LIYELREYVAHENAEQQVHARFRDATLPLFAKHGLEVVGFWTDQNDPTRILYLLRFEDEAAQARAWDGFQQDPAWKEAKNASEANGPIVASMTSRNLQSVPYWADNNQGDHQ
jgi:hypothetical protein